MEIYIKWIGEHCTTKRLTKMQPFYLSYIRNFIFGKSVLAHLVCVPKLVFNIHELSVIVVKVSFVSVPLAIVFKIVT